MPPVRSQEQVHEGPPAVNIPGAGVRIPLPSGQDMAYYGGLGAMTALQMIEWPVTLALGAGYALATHEHHQNGRK